MVLPQAAAQPGTVQTRTGDRLMKVGVIGVGDMGLSMACGLSAHP
jgi:hypothetical protein